MQKFVQPTKEQVRDWFRQRRLEAGPPPAIAQMRRELGWNPLLPDLLPELAAGAGHGCQPGAPGMRFTDGVSEPGLLGKPDGRF